MNTSEMQAGPSVRWWPSWSVTRLHALAEEPRDVHGARWARARCGEDVRDPEQLRRASSWHAQRLAADVSKCKRCERALAALEPR